MAATDLSPLTRGVASNLLQPGELQCDEHAADLHGVSDQTQLGAPLRGQDV